MYFISHENPSDSRSTKRTMFTSSAGICGSQRSQRAHRAEGSVAGVHYSDPPPLTPTAAAETSWLLSAAADRVTAGERTPQNRFVLQTGDRLEARDCRIHGREHTRPTGSLLRAMPNVM